jgi:hypothetical protein
MTKEANPALDPTWTQYKMYNYLAISTDNGNQMSTNFQHHSLLNTPTTRQVEF